MYECVMCCVSKKVCTVDVCVVCSDEGGNLLPAGWVKNDPLSPENISLLSTPQMVRWVTVRSSHSMGHCRETCTGEQ